MDELVQINQKQVFDMLDKFLKPKGFKKRANTWFLRNPNDVLVLVNFQKSAMGPDFYLNFGIYFDRLVGKKRKTYPSYDWQFDGRYEQMILRLNLITSIPECTKLFHLDISSDQLMTNLVEIRNNMEKYILPFLYQVTDYEYLKENFPHNFPRNIMWTKNYKYVDLKIFFDSQLKQEFRPAKEVFDEIERKRAI